MYGHLRHCWVWQQGSLCRLRERDWLRFRGFRWVPNSTSGAIPRTLLVRILGFATNRHPGLFGISRTLNLRALPPEVPLIGTPQSGPVGLRLRVVSGSCSWAFPFRSPSCWLMRPIFHLSFPVRDLAEAVAFYEAELGAEIGRRGASFADAFLFGAQVTLQHDPGNVLEPMPRTRHFGATVAWPEWEALAARLADAPNLVEEPCISYPGQATEQGKLMLTDPSGNLIEMKAYRYPDPQSTQRQQNNCSCNACPHGGDVAPTLRA